MSGAGRTISREVSSLQRNGTPGPARRSPSQRRRTPGPERGRSLAEQRHMNDAGRDVSGQSLSRQASPASRRGTPGPRRGRSPSAQGSIDDGAALSHITDRTHRSRSRHGRHGCDDGGHLPQHMEQHMQQDTHRNNTPGPTRSRDDAGLHQSGQSRGRGKSPFAEVRYSRGRSEKVSSPMERLRDVSLSLRSKSPFSRRTTRLTEESGGYPRSEAGDGDSASLPPIARALRAIQAADCASCSASSNRSGRTASPTSEVSRHLTSSEGYIEIDANGCCVHHPFVQLRRPKSGGGWRVMSRTCALCAEESEERETRRTAETTAVAALVADAALAEAGLVISGTPQAPSAPGAASARPHPLERQHSMLNTTSGLRGSILAAQSTDADDQSQSETVDSPRDTGDECSITPSFLESDDESGGKSDDDASCDGASCAPSVSDEGATQPPEESSVDDILSMNSMGEPLSPMQQPPRRMQSSALKDATSACPVDVKSVVSARSHRSRRSQRSGRSQRQHCLPTNKEEGDAVDILALEIDVQKGKMPPSVGVDMDCVESAMRKIKSMEQIQHQQQAAAAASDAANHSRAKAVPKHAPKSSSPPNAPKQPSKGKGPPKANKPAPPKHTAKAKARPPPPKPSSGNPASSKQRPPPPPPPRRRSSKTNAKARGSSNRSKQSKSGKSNKGNAKNGESLAVLNPHPEPELEDNFPMAELALPCNEFVRQNQPQGNEFMAQQQPQGSEFMAQQQPQGSEFMAHPHPHGNEFMTQQQPQNELMVLPQGNEVMPQQLGSELIPYQEPTEDKSKEWMKYATGTLRREQALEGDESKGKKLRNRLKGRIPAKHANNERQAVRSVKQMPFTDRFGDFGFYTGLVNEEGRPDGKGSMKYENGVYYEGTWNDGCQDSKAASQYERIRGGFTSWSGKGKSGTKSGTVLPWNARKNDALDATAKTNVRGMEWTDLNGDSGRYTGEVNNDRLPDGSGIMRYDFGLIAEGDWVNGVLREGPQDRLMGVAAAMNGGQSVAPGGPAINSGMSVGPGATGFASGAVSVLGGGGISVAPGAMGGGGVMSVAPSAFGGGGMNPMLAMANRGGGAAQHAMIAHQNAMMKGMYGGAGSVYGGAGAGASVYGGQMPVQPMMQQQQPPPPIMMPAQPQPQQLGNKPPISEIRLG